MRRRLCGTEALFEMLGEQRRVMLNWWNKLKRRSQKRIGNFD